MDRVGTYVCMHVRFVYCIVERLAILNCAVKLSRDDVVPVLVDGVERDDTKRCLDATGLEGWVNASTMSELVVDVVSGG